MRKIIVNWVQEDEELLEPYEWKASDDLEVLTNLTIYRVNEKTLHDFIYGCINIKEEKYYHSIFAVSDGNYCVVVETNVVGKLIYRSLVSYKDRDYINRKSCLLNETSFTYLMYDEGLMKEYGLTRSERVKKQYLEYRLDELYVEDYETFVDICQKLQIQGDKSITKYITLKKKIEKGYTFIHELLYNELSKNK